MRTLAELQSECLSLGIQVAANGRPSKDPYVAALRNHHWKVEHGEEPMPEEIQARLA